MIWIRYETVEGLLTAKWSRINIPKQENKAINKDGKCFAYLSQKIPNLN